MASTYYDDVDFESFSFDQDPLSPVWTHSDYDNQMSGMDTFWQNMGLPAEQHQHHLQHQSLHHNSQLLHQQHAPQHIQQHQHQHQHHTQHQQYNVQSHDTDSVTDNFSFHHQQHHPQVHQPQVHNGWSNTTNMMYIKQEVKQEPEQPQKHQHHTQPQQYGYYSNSSSQNSYDSSFSASTDSDAEFEDSQQSTSWEQPQQLQQHAHLQQHYSYPCETDHAMNAQTHSELVYIKPEMKRENRNTDAHSPDPHGSEDNSWASEETISFMADDENDPVDFKLPVSKTPIMEAMVVCAINNWGISVIKSTPGEVIFKVLDFDRYYRISRSICSKHRPTEDIGSRVKSLRRWFTNFPKKKDRQENPQFFLSVKPNTCKKVHGLIDRNTKLLNAQRKAR